ncbi:MAG: hypothetical protein KJ964_13890 [Verrucomicrobia bacterium]|nr:hypothetical protein [Verrucomicrobiota bacterium]MBU1734732.1 hypothetical protein [Verrucomicrobiota bacterium]MBU1857750.1 hypothetical protein [Verrucomicrobiota bacterium]
MADFGALTMVGLIATILSIGFALAAFINSRRRLGKKQDKSKDGLPGLPFLAPGEQAPRNTRAGPSLFYATASRQVSGDEHAKPAFKQTQMVNLPAGAKDPASSDEYLWE